eukprot:g14166.t1
MRPQKLSEVHGSSFYGSKQAPATPLRAKRKQEHDEPHHGALDGATASTEHGGKNDERHHDEAPEDERHHYEAPKDEHERHHDGGGVERVKLRGKSGTEEVRLKCKQGKGAEKTYTLSKTAKYYDLPCDFVGAGEEFTIEYIYDKFLANGDASDVFVTEQYDNQGDKDRHKQPFLIKSEGTHFAHDERVPGTSCPKYNTRGDQHGIRCAMIQDGLLAWRKLYTLKVKVRENTTTTTTTTTATAVLLMQDGANCETGWQPMGRVDCVAGPTVNGKKYTFAEDAKTVGECRNQWWPNYGCFLWQYKAYLSTCMRSYGQTTYNNLPPQYAHLGICVPAAAPPARVLKQNDANCETGWQPMGRDECVFGPTVEGGKKYTYSEDASAAGECRGNWPNTGCFLWQDKAYFSTCQGLNGQSVPSDNAWGICVPSPGVKESRKQVQKKKQVPPTPSPAPLRSKQNHHQPQLEKENHNAREKREEETKRNKKADHSNADGMGTSRRGAVDHSAEVEKRALRNATTGSAGPKDELRDDDEQHEKDDDRPAFPLLLVGIFVAAAVCFGCLGAICETETQTSRLFDELPDDAFRQKLRERKTDLFSRTTSPMPSEVDERIVEVLSRVFQFPSAKYANAGDEFEKDEESCRKGCETTFGCVAYAWTETRTTKRTTSSGGEDETTTERICLGVRGRPPATFVKLLREKLQAGDLLRQHGEQAAEQTSTSSFAVLATEKMKEGPQLVVPGDDSTEKSGADGPPRDRRKERRKQLQVVEVSEDSSSIGGPRTPDRAIGCRSSESRGGSGCRAGAFGRPAAVLCDAGDTGFHYEVKMADTNTNRTKLCSKLFSWRYVLHALTRSLEVQRQFLKLYEENLSPLFSRRVEGAPAKLSYAHLLQNAVMDTRREDHPDYSWVGRMRKPGFPFDKNDIASCRVEVLPLIMGGSSSHNSRSDGLQRVMDGSEACYAQCACGDERAVALERAKAAADDYTKDLQRMLEAMNAGGDATPGPKNPHAGGTEEEEEQSYKLDKTEEGKDTMSAQSLENCCETSS